METNTTTAKVAGFNDEQTHCDRCGKVELRGTVILRSEDGEVGRFGTTCATRELGIKVTRSDALRVEAGRRQSVTHLLLAAKRATDSKVRANHLREIDRYFTLVHADERRLYSELAAA